MSLEHRFEIADFMNEHDSFIRFSFRNKHAHEAEPIVQKAIPFIKICQTDVFVSAGDFLQASKEGEKALTDTLLKYVGQTKGRVADLFCGIGTFTYALASSKQPYILAVDESAPLLENFKKSANKNMLQNIEIKRNNLFLYPLTAAELCSLDIVVFDPPRAGAKAQMQELINTNELSRPKKVIAVSCNPKTFARDAKILISGGYTLQKITLVDQFVYSDHSELVALFTNEK